MNVWEAVDAVRAEVGAIGKEQRNTQQGYNFRGRDAVVNACNPAMSKVGLLLYPVEISEPRWGETSTANGKRMGTCMFVATYEVTTILGPDGGSFRFQVPAEATDLADKATGKALTYAERFAYVQLFNLPTDEPDPDESYEERGQSEAERLWGNIVGLCQANGISGAAVAAQFAELGGTGKASECADAALLHRLHGALFA